MATLADVAKLANVSKMTVSRVLNLPDQVSDELKSLVYQAMADLNYQPNRLARALVNQQNQMIKLMILEDTESVEPYYMALLTGIAMELDRHSYGLQILTRDSKNLGNSDGYIICGMREADFPEIDRLDKPVVLFGENKHGYDYVDSNNKEGIAQVTNYCQQVGYQNLVYIDMAIDEPFSRSRREGYQAVMTQLKKQPRILTFTNDSDAIFEYLMDQASYFQPGTAFICASDRLALGVVRALQIRGEIIPSDYGVTGHDGVFLDQITYPKLTTMKQDIKEMGAACANLLMGKIKQDKPGQHKLLFPTKLRLGGTTK